MESITFSEIQELLKKYGLSPLKKLGQNFLTDANVIKNIVDSMPIDENSNVLEIGPGLGSLTREIAKKAKRVVAVDIDAGMVRVLSDTFKETKNVTIIHKDILKTDIEEIKNTYFDGEEFHACGNLPYYITAKCLLKMCESGAKSMTAMVQKEVAERLAAAPGTKEYGSITASIAYYSVPKMLFTVSKNCFYPAPDVESAIISAVLNDKTLDINRDKYTEVLRACFAQRRKTIFNNLSSAYGKKISKDDIKAALTDTGITPETRAEMLSPETFANLAKNIYKYL